MRGLYLAATALLILTVLPTPLVTMAAATDVPSNTHVCGGMAYAFATDALSAGVSYQFALGGTTTGSCGTGLGGAALAHRTGWAVAALTSITFTWTTSDTSATLNLPDGDAGDLCRASLYHDNSGSASATFFTGATCPTSGNTYPLSFGIGGTMRVRLEVIQANEITGNYNLDTDTRTGNLYAGAVRGGLTGVALTAGSYPAGTTYAYTVAGEVATINLAHFNVGAGQTTTNVEIASRDGADAVIKTNTVALAGASGSTTFAIDDAYAAAAAGYGATLTVPASATSGLTGQRWTHISAATSPTTVDSEFVAKRTNFYNIDPRVTATHLMQNDNTFSTPPMAENDGDDSRYGTDLAYVATRFTNARGEGLSGGSFAFTSTLRDSGLVVPLDARSQGTGLTIDTQGGEAGWSTLRIFNDGAPQGTWNKVVDVTAPAAIDSDAHLVTATKAYSVTIPAGDAEGMGDPLKVFVSPLVAGPEDTVRFAASEAFLDGTARTMNAADTLVYLYDPSGDLVVNGGATVELHDGIYTHTYTLNATPENGHWVVVIETTDPVTMDPVTTSNTFLVIDAADVAASLQDHRDRSLELDMHDPTLSFNGLGLDGFLIVAAWFIAFFVMLYMHKVFGAFAAFLGLFDAITDILPGSWMFYALLFILALWLEALVGDKVYQKWLGMTKKPERDA